MHIHIAIYNTYMLILMHMDTEAIHNAGITIQPPSAGTDYCELSRYEVTHDHEHDNHAGV